MNSECTHTQHKRSHLCSSLDSFAAELLQGERRLQSVTVRKAPTLRLARCKSKHIHIPQGQKGPQSLTRFLSGPLSRRRSPTCAADDENSVHCILRDLAHPLRLSPSL